MATRASHFVRCLGAVLQKNFILKSRGWLSTLLELLLPVALMLLLVWIRSEIKTEFIPARSYVEAPQNNPTWFPDVGLNISDFPGLPAQQRQLLQTLCKGSFASCPALFASNWPKRKEYYLGSALDVQLLLHLAVSQKKLAIVGSQSLRDFIAAIPGYAKATRFFGSEEEFKTYLSSRDYGFTESSPALFGAIEVRSEATCPRKPQGAATADPLAATCKGTWDIVVHLNASGPGTTDLQASTGVNTKLMPAVNKLQKGLSMSTSRVYWSGGLARLGPLAMPTGGLVDLQSLIYAWIFNSTGAYKLARPDELPHCDCVDPKGQITSDLSSCNSSQLFLMGIRSLTPHWASVVPGSGGTALGCLGRLSGLLPVSLREIPFPTPSYTSDPFATFVEGVFGLFFVLVFIWPLTRIMKSLVEDKEARLNEVMKMMGMPAEGITLGWYFTYGLLWLLPAMLMVVVCWGSVFEHSNKFIVMSFFWIFGVCTITLCSLISIFFERAKAASVVGALIFFLLYFPYLFVKGESSSISTKNFACLSPPVALSIGAGVLAELESSGDGLQFGNLGERVANFSMGRVFFMLLLDTVLFAFSAWYLDKVFVVGFGTRQPWWFFCSKRFWRPSQTSMSDQELRDLEEGFDDEIPANDRYEAVPSELAAQRSVMVRGLCKEFKTADGKVLKAVQNVTLNLYSGEIFCLLGHNGAGKSTTINMLSGMLPVTSGDAIIYGKSVRKDMQQIREILGVCPQHDVIWSDLSVEEHLEFFVKLKGVSPEDVPSEVTGLIEDVGLAEKQNALACTLSGGQKRRLSAAIALCGGSKVVFLDEPSSGVDPFSRRELWNCLRQKKSGRTLILTTHFMDEAEELGDRIGIMAAGQVKCMGSALFLKSKYGVGYTLTITKKPSAADASSAEVAELIQNTCCGSERLSDVGTELVYRMPMEASSNFPHLFEVLEKEPAKYGVENFGVSVTTLEEVFLRVGRDHTEAEIAADERLQQASFVRQISSERERETPVSRQLTDSFMGPEAQAQADKNAFGRHVFALLVKRFHNARRDKKAWCCQIAMPLIFLLMALVTMRFAGIGDYEVAPLTLASISSDQELLFGAGPGVNETDAAKFWSGARGVRPMKLPGHFNASEFSSQLARDYYRGNALSRFAALRFQALPNWTDPGFRRPGHALVGGSPLEVPVGTLWDEQAKTLTGSNVPMGKLNNRLQADIFWNSTARDVLPAFHAEVHEAALRSALGAKLGDAEVKIGQQAFPLTAAQKDLTDTQTSLNVALGFAFIPASFGAFVVLERETGSKHLQVISGVNFIAYWLSTWIWDIVNYLVPAGFSLLLMFVFGVQSLVSSENLPWTIMSILLFGVSCSSFTYGLSFFFRSHTSAQNLLLIVYLFTGGILMIVAIILAVIPSTKDLVTNVLIYLFRLLPNFCLADSLTNLITRSNPGLWMSRGCPLEGCNPEDLVITGWDNLYMGLGSLVWFSLTLLLELAFATPKLRSALRLQNVDVPSAERTLDADVQREKERVQSGDADNEMVVVKGLRKVYPGRKRSPPKVAVDDVYFGIKEGECFGYLGLNGAGKTTTMKMLTGEELTTRGEATLGGYDIKTQQNQVRQLIGYCPQFDALIPTLTAREHLTLFARIKGVEASKMKMYVDRMLDKLTLTPYADKQAYSFSGGTRRKLSLGLSLVGNPRCVFLDEPTTGVDPESRRFMWKLISQTMSGRSVILTTHSMDECDALCHRIGIMVNGHLVCLGSAAQLKSTHGYGYGFEVTFKADTDLLSANAQLRHFLQTMFGDVRCEDELGAEAEGTGARARYRLPKDKAHISQIFREVEKRRAELSISEYSVSETTLEQLFLQFARHQADEDGPTGSSIQASARPEQERQALAASQDRE